MKKGIYWSLFLCYFHVLNGQDNPCKIAISEAHKLYEAGSFTKSLEELQACTGKNISPSFRLRISRIKALCYYQLNNDSMMHHEIWNMLRIDPFYTSHSYSDPIGFKRMMEQYEVQSKWNFGFYSGYNLQKIGIIKSFQAIQGSIQSRPGGGFQLYGSLGYQVNGKNEISFQPGLLYQTFRMVYRYDEGWEGRYQEYFTGIMMPLQYNRHVILNRKFRLTISPGIQACYQLQTFASGKAASVDGFGTNQVSRESTASRASWLYGINTGVSISFPAGGGRVVAGMSYQYFVNKYNIPAERYNDPAFIVATDYIDPDMRTTHIQLSAGYQIPFHYQIKRKP